jgi:hypothetical protein
MKSHAFFSCVAVLSFTTQFSTAIAQQSSKSTSKSQASNINREIQPENQKIQIPQNMIHVWGGIGTGFSYHRLLPHHVSLGVSASMDSTPQLNYQNIYSLNNNNEYEYRYDAKFKVSTISTMVHATWLSGGNDGFIVGALFGASLVQASVKGFREYYKIGALNSEESVSLAQVKNDLAPTLGAQVGYTWAFNSGFTLGFILQMLGTQAYISNFSASTSASTDAKFYDELEERIQTKILPSSLGILFGFAF